MVFYRELLKFHFSLQLQLSRTRNGYHDAQTRKDTMEAETSKFKVSARNYAIKYDQQGDLKHNGYLASE